MSFEEICKGFQNCQSTNSPDRINPSSKTTNQYCPQLTLKKRLPLQSGFAGVTVEHDGFCGRERSHWVPTSQQVLSLVNSRSLVALRINYFFWMCSADLKTNLTFNTLRRTSQQILILVNLRWVISNARAIKRSTTGLHFFLLRRVSWKCISLLIWLKDSHRF